MIARVRPRKMEGKRGEKAGISGTIARGGKYSRPGLVKRGKISYNNLKQKTDCRVAPLGLLAMTGRTQAA